MERTKKGRKAFSSKKSFRANKKDINKVFDKSKFLCYYCQKSGHFAHDSMQGKEEKKGFMHPPSEKEVNLLKRNHSRNRMIERKISFSE